jgi:hypothetical protein
MPTLACRICGRVVYMAASLESLFPEERRCPRCGSMLFPERRRENRREGERRSGEPDAPDAPEAPATPERRTGHRRRLERRRDDGKSF